MPINYSANRQPNTCGLTCPFAGLRPYNRSLHTYTHDHKPPGMFVPPLYAKPHTFTGRQHITARSLVYSSRRHMPHSGMPTGLWTVSGAGSLGRPSTMAPGLRPHA